MDTKIVERIKTEKDPVEKLYAESVCLYTKLKQQ